MRHHLVAGDLRVHDLADAVPVGEADHKAVLRRVVLVVTCCLAIWSWNFACCSASSFCCQPSSACRKARMCWTCSSVCLACHSAFSARLFAASICDEASVTTSSTFVSYWRLASCRILFTASSDKPGVEQSKNCSCMVASGCVGVASGSRENPRCMADPSLASAIGDGSTSRSRSSRKVASYCHRAPGAGALPARLPRAPPPRATACSCPASAAQWPNAASLVLISIATGARSMGCAPRER